MRAGSRSSAGSGRHSRGSLSEVALDDGVLDPAAASPEPDCKLEALGGIVACSVFIVVGTRRRTVVGAAPPGELADSSQDFDRVTAVAVAAHQELGVTVAEAEIAIGAVMHQAAHTKPVAGGLDTTAHLRGDRLGDLLGVR